MVYENDLVKAKKLITYCIDKCGCTSGCSAFNQVANQINDKTYAELCVLVDNL